MRNILGFGAVLAASYLFGAVGLAQAQTGAGNQAPAGNQGGSGAAGVSGRVNTTEGSSLITAPNNLEQQANENAANAAAAVRPSTNAAAPIPGQVAGAPTQPGVGTPNAGAPGIGNTGIGNTGVGTPGIGNTGIGNPAVNSYSTPGTPGMVANPANGTQVGVGNNAPGNANPTGTNPMPPGTPGEWNYRAYPAVSNAYSSGVQQGNYPGTATAATPGYTSRVMPGMNGYNAVNPMATTMAPGYYYADTAGMPYATSNTPTYSPYGTTGYYTAPTQGYVVQRRGLFGRRNRVVYSGSPYGTNAYGSYPSGYTNYGTTTYYTTPGTYNYGTTTYSTVPGGYSYGAYPR
jgi:hypothetical protein